MLTSVLVSSRAVRSVDNISYFVNKWTDGYSSVGMDPGFLDIVGNRVQFSGNLCCLSNCWRCLLRRLYPSRDAAGAIGTNYPN